MASVNELARAWHEWAMEQVPPEYALRRMHHKYLKGDNDAAGMDNAAADLEEVAHTAWRPVSEPPTEEDGDSCGNVIVFGHDSVEVLDWSNVPKCCLKDHLWARIRDVVLMPEGEL